MSLRRYAVLGVLLSGAGLLAASTRTWLSGRTSDPVLEGSLVVATGSQVAPAAVGLAVVGLAALVAVLTTGPRTRVVATVVLLCAATAMTYAVARVALHPVDALSLRVAEQAGRTGPIAAEARVGPWTWFALACGVASLASAALLSAATRGSRGLSRRFDRPATAVVSQGERMSSSWDALSEGVDPTADSDDERA